VINYAIIVNDLTAVNVNHVYVIDRCMKREILIYQLLLARENHQLNQMCA